MSAPHPHSLADLALAPVLIELERGLDELRRSEDLGFSLVLYLNDQPSAYRTAAERASRIRRYVVRDHDLHNWTVEPTPDCHGLAVEHGEYKISLMFGKKLLDYIEHG
jgi:hypothetical protein